MPVKAPPPSGGGTRRWQAGTLTRPVASSTLCEFSTLELEAWESSLGRAGRDRLRPSPIRTESDTLDRGPDAGSTDAVMLGRPIRL